MLFLAIQTHKPKDCPVNHENHSPLWDTKNEKVTVKNIYACPPTHVLYFVLESSDFSEIQEFFAPGMGRSVVDIKPVSEVK